ncbi:MAG: hypothetical protein R3C58_01455 [Parvularculaceae bacterium]
MPGLRTLIMGAGALAAVGGVATLPVLVKPHEASLLSERASYEVCLKSDLVFFKDAPAKCYAPADVRALADHQVLDSGGEPASLAMVHPTDATMAPMDCRTCAQYREARFDGWFVESARDMRREAYFVRACGVLAAIAEAQAAKESYFTNGSPAEAEVAALASTMSFGEPQSENQLVAKGSNHVWMITSGPATIAMQELANADFDNDGVEEILVTFTGGLAGGTAAYHDVGYLEKDGPGAALAFSPLDFESARNGAAGG